MASSDIDQHDKIRQWEPIFPACFIEIAKVDAAHDLPIFYFHGHNISEPGRIFYHFDKTNVEKLVDVLLNLYF